MQATINIKIPINETVTETIKVYYLFYTIYLTVKNCYILSVIYIFFVIIYQFIILVTVAKLHVYFLTASRFFLIDPVTLT